MKKCNFKRVLFCAVFLIFHAAGFAVSPYEPQVVKAFADSLYQEGFLSQAEGEYKRFL